MFLVLLIVELHIYGEAEAIPCLLISVKFP